MCNSCGKGCIPTVPGPHVQRTTDVHGIPDTSKLETKSGAAKKADQAANKVLIQARQEIAKALSNVEAPDMSQYETKTGAQGRVDQHAGKTRDVHGIPDTSKLITEDEIGPLVEAAVADAVGDLEIPSGEGWETPEGAQAKVDEHAQKTTDVHGIADTSVLVTQDQLKAVEDKIPTGGDWETPDGAQAKADKALADGKKYTDDHAAKTTDVHGIKDTAQLATKDELKAVEDKIPAGGGEQPSGGLTEEQAQQIAAKAVEDALAKHIENCHTLEIITEGVTAEAGWEVQLQELRTLGGVSSAFIRLTRTGEHIYSKDADFRSEGLPAEGNLDDLKIATITGPWVPPQSYEVSAHTSHGSGSVRVETDGEVYLLDWTSNNPLRTDHIIRISYEFLTESKCQGATGGQLAPAHQKPTPKPVKPTSPAKSPASDMKLRAVSKDKH